MENGGTTMNIGQVYERRLAGYTESMRGLEADLASAAEGTADPVIRGALEQLLRSVRAKQSWIGTDGRLEVDAAQVRIDAGQRAFEELRARKEALAERMEQLRATLKSPTA